VHWEAAEHRSPAEDTAGTTQDPALSVYPAKQAEHAPLASHEEHWLLWLLEQHLRPKHVPLVHAALNEHDWPTEALALQ